MPQPLRSWIGSLALALALAVLAGVAIATHAAATTFTETPLDVSASATGLKIQNDGDLIRAYHFGTSGAAATVHGVTFGDGASPNNGGVLDSAMSGCEGGWTNWNYWNHTGATPSDPNYSRLITSMVAAASSNSQITIGGLIAGHTYRMQMISNNPRGGFSLDMPRLVVTLCSQAWAIAPPQPIELKIPAPE